LQFFKILVLALKPLLFKKLGAGGRDFVSIKKLVWAALSRKKANIACGTK
jgi:hypothetical protein